MTAILIRFAAEAVGFVGPLLLLHVALGRYEARRSGRVA